MTFPDRGNRRRWTTAAILAAVLLTGCGSDDSDSATVNPPSDAPPPASSSAPGAPPPAPGALKAAVAAGEPLAVAQLDAVVAGTTAAGFAGAPRCDVRVIAIRYGTVAPDGVTPTEASGAVMVPSGAACPGPFPLVAYSRGTDLDKARSMATPGDSEARLVAGLLASQGFMVAATDYLGYAGSTWPDHPYLHAGSEATANVDALRAAREVARQQGIALNGKVFLTGYSQGGHASMATQKLIQASLGSEFALAGAGHMSGPYDLVGTVRSAVDKLPLGDLGSTYYVPFAVTSFQKIYGNLYAEPGEFFKSPYDRTVEGLLPTSSDVSLQDLFLKNKLPLLLDSLVTEPFVEAARNDTSTLHRALAVNSATDLVPRVPTLLCGGSRDPVVGYDNTRNALAVFQAAGTSSVSAFDVEQEPAYAPLLRDDLVPTDINTGYHASLVPPLCLLQVRNFFLTL